VISPLFRVPNESALAEKPLRLMLAVNAAVLIGVFFYKISREPYVSYIFISWSTIISALPSAR
jgi:hypothetical protein